ncbi:VOC family protein [Microcoleus sp. Pol7_A1]|uniref:VOC family protein n=1 Tax=Microcoleus sp. Pol7_A1 TaxID=2818893 RepID=UPI002FD48CF5
MQKIRAIALMVKDADRSHDFYRKALSFEPVSDITVEGQKFALLLLGLRPTGTLESTCRLSVNFSPK